MRSRWLLPALALLTVAALAPSGRAQQPYRQQPERSTPRAGGSFADDGPDLLRPYGTRSQRAGDARGYYASPVAHRVNPVRTAYQAPRHGYFPGLRSGQGPNRNVTGPLCVPGRHVFLGGR